jgi:hypothetical protein
VPHSDLENKRPTATREVIASCLLAEYGLRNRTGFERRRCESLRGFPFVGAFSPPSRAVPLLDRRGRGGIFVWLHEQHRDPARGLRLDRE